MAAVACVGIAVMDLMFQVESLPTAGGKYYATGYREVGGGVAANAAVAIANLGGEAHYVGRVGDDALGARVVADLDAAGVDVTRIGIVPGVATPVSAVVVDRAGERMIINHTPGQLFAGGETSAARALSGIGAVLVDVRWPAGAAAALAAARAAGIPGIFDFDRPMSTGGAGLLAAASHVAFSQEALAQTSGVDDPVEGLGRMAAETDAWLAVTVGSAGVFWREGVHTRHFPAFDVEVVDTVGAGDVFHGALALALAEGQPEPAGVRFAAAAAALKCTRPGGRSGIPSRAEVEQLLEESV